VRGRGAGPVDALECGLVLTGSPAPGRAAPRVVVVGDAGLDIVIRTDALPAPGGDARARITVAPGGAGANTAAWLAACGARPTLVARVGADPAAGRLRAELAAAGVDCRFAVDREATTCQVAVLVDAAGQRTMLADRGAAARLAPADLPASLAGAAHLHLSGYVLLDPSSRPAGRAALAAARAAGLTTSVDPQAAVLLTDPGGFLADIAGVDLLLPSAAELAALGDAALAAARAVAVTAGVAGATWIEGTTRVHVPAQPVAVADSTGAGDAFDAGLLAAWLAGADPAAALRAGVAAATRAVARLGARP
jgi:sugar/nucleoside kinase (ribokinase family)